MNCVHYNWKFQSLEMTHVNRLSLFLPVPTFTLYQRFSNYGPRISYSPRDQPLWSLKNILQKEKWNFKWIAIGENLSLEITHGNHLALFFQYWHFMKFITLPIYQLPTLLSPTKEGFKPLLTCSFSQSFPSTSGATPVTQPGTTRIHNRGPKYWTFSYNYDIINPSAYLAVSETEAQHFHIAYPAIFKTDFAHPWKFYYNFGQTWQKTIKQYSLNSWSFTLSCCIQFNSFCITTKSTPVSKFTVSFTEGKIKWYFAGSESLK